jgi:phosphatidate cytidylyltransferase
MAPLAIAAAWFGGWPFALFWGLAALGVWWEWMTLVAANSARPVMWTGAVALVLAIALGGSGRLPDALIVIALGAVATNVVAPAGRGGWVGAGMLYAGALAIAPVVLRRQDAGLATILLIFAVVWTTDILGYFVGRAVGGPKLWPRVSPNKTWSGAMAGLAGSVAAAMIFVLVTGTGSALYVAMVALGLSIASQGGDLFESAVKRRFGAKDASGIIPGHGGLMDRLDGFVAATTLAALCTGIGSIAVGPGQGLLQW